jgi:hypothetical protein
MPESGKYYMLVNPYIEGSTLKVFKADNSLAASKTAYESISKYFNNEVPNFNFTLLKIKSDAVTNENKLHKFNLESYGTDPSNNYFNKNNFSHFTVNETANDKNQVSFKISKFEQKVPNLDLLVKNIMKIQSKYSSQSGGSDNSSQSDGSNSNDSSQTGGSSSDNSSQSDGSNSNDSSQTGGSNSNDSSQTGGSSSNYSSDSGSTELTKSPELSQSGGLDKKAKRHSKRRDDDEDDDDSPDYYVKRYYYDPISYWYYVPSLYGINSFYFPMFSAPISAPVFIDNYPLVTTSLNPLSMSIGL